MIYESSIRPLDVADVCTVSSNHITSEIENMSNQRNKMNQMKLFTYFSEPDEPTDVFYTAVACLAIPCSYLTCSILPMTALHYISERCLWHVSYTLNPGTVIINLSKRYTLSTAILASHHLHTCS
jgi:hypothetical protein